MAKKKKVSKTKRKSVFEFPPDIFWIAPSGDARDIIGHVTSIQGHPEAYGFHAPPQTKEEIDEALTYLFQEGWVRGRFSSGKFSFQMERPRGTPMGNAYDLVRRFQDQATEVEVDFWDPNFKVMGISMAAKEFMAQKFPSRWGLGRSDQFEEDYRTSGSDLEWPSA